MHEPRTLPLTYWPDDILRQVAEPVTKFNDSLLEWLVNDMIYTMRCQDGIGLAAPQVGVNKRIFVMDFFSVDQLNMPDMLVCINPKIINTSREQFKWKEGCLSVPGHFETRSRPQKVMLEYQDVTGKEFTTVLEDLVAFAALHEYDHLEGKVFVDGSSSFKTQRIQKKMQKTIKIMRNTNGN